MSKTKFKVLYKILKYDQEEHPHTQTYKYADLESAKKDFDKFRNEVIHEDLFGCELIDNTKNEEIDSFFVFDIEGEE